MRKLKLIFGIVLFISLICCKTVANNSDANTQTDTTKNNTTPTTQTIDKTKPFFKVETEEIILESKGQQFVSKEIRFFNRSVGILKVESVIPSCDCTTAKVTLGNVQSMGYGVIVLNVNVAELAGLPSKMEIIVNSNASNSPSKLTLIVK